MKLDHKETTNVIEINVELETDLVNFLLNPPWQMTANIGESANIEIPSILIKRFSSDYVKDRESIDIIRHSKKRKMSKHLVPHTLRLSQESVAALDKFSRLTGFSRSRCIDQCLRFLVDIEKPVEASLS
jgi:hypothetical protein